MLENFLTPLKFGRETANKKRKTALTQEMLAELLKNQNGESISVRQVCAYETGQAPTPDYIIDQAIDICDVPIMAYLHLLQSPVGLRVLPEIECTRVSQAAVRLFTAIEDYRPRQLEIMRKVGDDRIDETEEEGFEEDKKVLLGIIKACYEVIYAKTNGGKE